MPRWISLSVALLAAIALFSGAGFVLARWSEWEAGIRIFMPALQYSLYGVVACCAYAAFVGVYHTILSVTGLDEERDEEAS